MGRGWRNALLRKEAISELRNLKRFFVVNSYSDVILVLVEFFWENFDDKENPIELAYRLLAKRKLSRLRRNERGVEDRGD